MELSNTLLVALMFTTILTVGIIGTLGCISSMVMHGSALRLDPYIVCWIVLLLLLQLSLFWETLTILERQDWGYGGFLYVIAGPILLVIASHLVGSKPDDVTLSYSREHYKSIKRPYFLTLCLVMLWVIGMDALSAGITINSGWEMILFVLFGLLAATHNESIHRTVAGLTMMLMVSMFVMRGIDGVDLVNIDV